MSEQNIDITEKPIDNNIKIIDTISNIIEPVEPVNINITDEKTRKKYKPLSEEAKQKRAEILKKARIAKAEKNKNKSIMDTKINFPVEIIEKPKMSKEEKQKLREEEIASIVDKKLREYKEEKELNRKRTTLRDFF